MGALHANTFMDTAIATTNTTTFTTDNNNAVI